MFTQACQFLPSSNHTHNSLLPQTQSTLRSIWHLFAELGLHSEKDCEKREKERHACQFPRLTIFTMVLRKHKGVCEQNLVDSQLTPGLDSKRTPTHGLYEGTSFFCTLFYWLLQCWVWSLQERCFTVLVHVTLKLYLENTLTWYYAHELSRRVGNEGKGGDLSLQFVYASACRSKRIKSNNVYLSLPPSSL